jgi:hypothetical protein
MIPDIPKKIELLFWDHAIHAVSDNQQVEKVVRKGMVFVNSDPIRGTRILYTILAACGLAAGVLGYQLTRLF